MANTISERYTPAMPMAVPSQPARAVWTIERVIAAGLVFAVVFINGADFRGDSGEDFQIHWQIYLRLLVCFSCGLFGALSLFPKTWREFITWPGMLLSFYCGLYGLTLATSVAPSYSAAAWVSLIGVVLFIPAAMRLLGGRRMLFAVASGLATHLIGSWIAYLWFPEIGVFHEHITETDVYDRMGGLAHPNELGFYAAFTTLLFGGLGVVGRIGRWSAAAGMLLGSVTIFSCFSRTAAIACMLGLMCTFQRPLRMHGNVVALLLSSGVVLAACFVVIGSGKLDWYIDELVVKVTKSGSADELATATGRTEIWAYAIEMIRRSPLTGYGYGTTRFVMQEHSYHGHNVILNAMLYGGVLSGLVMLAMLAYLGWSLVAAPRPEIDGMVVAMLAGGMVDGILGAPSPSAFTLVWMMSLLWRQMQMSLD